MTLTLIDRARRTDHVTDRGLIDKGTADAGAAPEKTPDAAPRLRPRKIRCPASGGISTRGARG
ncbi:hypothetical protein I3W98_13260, partial [Streptomyces cavourensis]|nr:hypothetical protein [Streptomyces cavourensis]